LIGNPGDVGAALVLPALLLWMKAVDPTARRKVRLFAVAGLAGTFLGLGATEAIGPLVAIGVGLALHAVGDIRGRAPYLLGAAVIVLAAAAVTGIGPRALEKLGQVRRGELAAASTQRDIGIFAAGEMVRVHPLLGVGPG